MAINTNLDKLAKSPPSIWSRLAPLFSWPWELIPLLILLEWLYQRTMPPGISSWLIEGWDSAMFQITGSTWGVPHSPGYPLYIILSNLFVRLLGFLPGLAATEVVWRVSFWSIVTSLLTVVVVYLTTRRLSRSRGAAIIASALLAVSFIFWRGAIMAEVYSLNTLIFALTYGLAVTWARRPRRRWLIALGLVLGAGLAHHRTAFILPPTVAFWVALKFLKDHPGWKHPILWKNIAHSWLFMAGSALIPLLSFLYLPWAAQHGVGQTWIYADTSDWNTFWFVVLTREWWGLVHTPSTLAAWLEALLALFLQQANQITSIGVIVGLAGLAARRRYVWLLGLPLLALVWFGVSYQVADLDSMLMPLTLTLCLGVGLVLGGVSRYLTCLVVNLLKPQDEVFRRRWLPLVTRLILALSFITAAYFLLQPLAAATYIKVDLSGDWQAFDLVEEVVAIAQAGTPLTIIGQDNSVLPDFIYTRAVLGQPVEALSTTRLSRMPEAASISLLQNHFQQGRRILVDRETIDLGFIPWLNEAIRTGRIFLAPTGHPYLWELLPRPLSNVLPPSETWQQIPPGQFMDGTLSIIAYQQRLVRKRTGCFLRLTLFWRAEKYIDADYYVSVQPLGGETVLDKNDHLALLRGYLPTSQLRPGEIARDEVDLLIRQPAALPGVMLVTNLYQVQGDQFPTFGEVTLPIGVNPAGCK